MRIVKISVTELFGISTFNYEINLKTEERITIIHGPNGSGKTVLFKMISGLFNGKLSVFWKYPFRKFQLDFDDGENLSVKRKYDQASQDYSAPVITYSRGRKNSIDLGATRNYFRHVPVTFRRRLAESDFEDLFELAVYENFFDSEKRFYFDEYLARHGDEILFDIIREAEWLRDLVRGLRVNFIHTNRLLIEPTQKGQGSAPDSGTVTAITENSKDLALRIQEKILEADTQAKTLDRTFPSRIVNNVALGEEGGLEYSEIRISLDNLEIERKRLIEVGLLEPGKQETEFQIPEELADIEQERTLRSVLEMYIDDTRSKLQVYQELANRIELFRDVIQGMITHKKLHISKNGFALQSDFDQAIPLDELSSGEQHLLVLIYNLLFRQKGDVPQLILIDEPEISLHISWQKRFIDDLLRIIQLSDFDVIIATHAPSIINGRLDLMVGLQGESGQEG